MGDYMKKALITGITGQDGSYLTELLLDKGYDVHGLIRKSSSFNTDRIDHLYENPNIGYKTLHLHYGDMTDANSINRILNKVKPDEIYNLSAQSHVMVSFELPEFTGNTVALGAIRLLDAIKDTQIQTKYYQASTSELFGGLEGTQPQNENTPFTPRSPYAIAKLYAYWATVNYREAYNMFACNGILFNHTSPRRLPTFVCRKITQAVSRIYFGKQSILTLGNLDAQRDFGFARDFVEGMYMMLQQDSADDYVLATGETHTIREFVEKAFKYVDINIEWQGSGVDEIGINARNNKKVVEVDKRFFRPLEVDILLGDSSKAKSILGWSPKTTFEDLVNLMMDADLKLEDNR